MKGKYNVKKYDLYTSLYGVYSEQNLSHIYVPSSAQYPTSAGGDNAEASLVVLAKYLLRHSLSGMLFLLTFVSCSVVLLSLDTASRS